MCWLLAAAGAAAGFLLVRKGAVPSVDRLIDRCEEATSALEQRLCWLSGLGANESAATR